MSPEQAAGQDIDERTDVYALGAILYNVLAGQPPSSAELPPRVPVDLRAIADRAMASSPEARYATAKDMAEELRRFEAGQLLRSRDYRLRDLVARWVRRHRTAVVVGALALVIVAVVGIGALINVARSRTAERAARQTAERALQTADADVAALLEEQGRVLLLSGDRERALTYLAAASARGHDTVGLRHLLAVATRDLELFDHGLTDPAGGVTSLGFMPDGRLVTVGGSITTWNRDQPVTSHKVDPGYHRDSWLDPALRRTAMIDDNGALATFDVATGKQLWRIETGDADTRVVLGAGPQLVVLDERGAQLRDVERGTLAATLVAGPGIPTAAAISPDGRLVAVANRDGALGVWQTGSRALVTTKRTAQELTAITFLGADRIVTGSAQGRAEIWQLDRETPVVSLSRGAPIRSLAVSPRLDLIATGDSVGTVRLWDVRGTLLGEAHDQQGAVEELRFSPNGAQLLGAGLDKRVLVWDTAALELVRAVTNFIGGEILRVTNHGLAWAPDGSHFVTTRHRDDPVVWHTPLGHRLARLASSASASSATSALIVDGGAATIVQLATGKAVSRFAIPAGPVLPQLSFDGRRALVWHDQLLRASIYDLPAGRALATIKLLHPTVGDVGAEAASYVRLGPTLSADGRFVLEIPYDRGPKPARVFDAGSGRLIREFAHPDLTGAAISPTGDRVVLVLRGKPPTMWRVATGEQLAFPARDEELPRTQAVVFDRSGRRLLFHGTPMPIVVDADTGATIARLDPVGPTGTVYGAKLDDDGDRAVTWSFDRSAKLWNVATGAPVVTVEAVPLGAAAVSGDGLRFATGSDDGSVRIWDGTSARLLEVIPGDGTPTWQLTWSADSTRLVVQSAMRRTSIWDVHTEQRPFELIRALADRSTGWVLAGGVLIPKPR